MRRLRSIASSRATCSGQNGSLRDSSVDIGRWRQSGALIEMVHPRCRAIDIDADMP